MIQRFQFEETGIEGLKLIDPFIAFDDRGYYMKYYEHHIFEENNIYLTGHEEAQSISKKGVIRGLHFQTEHPQAKLVRVAAGEAFDVAVDLRPASPTFGQWRGFHLSDENKKMLYIPAGFAHGLMALTDQMKLCYISGDDYSPESDTGIVWNDPDIGVLWPTEMVDQVILSDRDQHLQTFQVYCRKVQVDMV